MDVHDGKHLNSCGLLAFKLLLLQCAVHIDARMHACTLRKFRRLLTLSRWVVDLGGERERESVCVQYKE